jgi:hypothetical protein
VIAELKILWKAIPHPERSVVRWFAKKGQHRIGEFAESPEELALAIGSSPGYDFYIQPNPTESRLGIRTTAKDVTHWSFLFLDVDPVEADCDAFGALHEYIRVLSDILCRTLHPTLIDSGRGAQAWIRLADTPLVDVESGSEGRAWLRELSRKRARQTMGHWLKHVATRAGTVKGCKLDTSVSDLPRVMRCPGTINSKTGKRASLVRLGGIHGGIAEMLVVGTPPEAFLAPDPDALPAGTPWQIAKPILTQKARRFLDEGWAEPGRHDAAWATAKSLHDKGVSRTEALKALEHGNVQCRPEPLPASEVVRIVESIFSAESPPAA